MCGYLNLNENLNPLKLNTVKIQFLSHTVATFQGLLSHMWQFTTVLDSTDIAIFAEILASTS